MARYNQRDELCQVTSMVLVSDGDTWGPTLAESASLPVMSSAKDDIHHTGVAQGFRPPLPYWANGYNRSPTSVNIQVEFPTTGGRTCRGTASGLSAASAAVPPGLPTLISDSAISRAIIEMIKGVGNQKWSAGQMIAEMQGSIDLIGSSATKLANGLAAASRRDWRGIARAFNVSPRRVKSGSTSAQGWLEYQFGWAPVVQDLANSALFLAGEFDERDVPLIKSATRIDEQDSQSSVGSFQQTMGSSPGSVTGSTTDKVTVSDSYQASVYYEIDVSWLRGLGRYGIVGLSTPWAILPSSYLADWVLPIGDLLAAWDATLGLAYKGGSSTRFRRSQISRKLNSFDPYYSGSVPTGSVLFGVADRYDMVRAPWLSSPLPFPAYIKNPFTTFKAITATALLRQYSTH